MYIGNITKIKFHIPRFSLKPSGISLIEVLIALTVLIVGAICIVTFFPLGLESVKSSEHETVAVNLAQAKIEEIISTSYSDVSTGEIVESSLSSIDSDFSSYSRTTSTYFIDSDLNVSEQDLGLKKVNVTVSWFDNFNNATTSVNLIILIADY